VRSQFFLTTMNRLQSEWQRLFLVDGGLINAQGEVRALVLGLARPGDWTALRQLWQGVQQDLGWPAPAIAVNGVDGYELWLGLAQPVPAAQAEAAGRALLARYLSDAAPQRVGLWPHADVSAPAGHVHAPLVPLQQAGTELWSAFVAPDLAPVFEDTPFLDFPPGADGQAELLARMSCVSPTDWQRGLAMWMPAPQIEPQAEVMPSADANTQAGRAGQAGACGSGLVMAIPAAHRDPVRFLQDVMANEAVPLALRMDAAKALLQTQEVPQ
jgi:hypothetical protein